MGKVGRLEGWKDGEGWKVGRMEDWKGGRMEGWKDGRLEEWKDGRLEALYVPFKTLNAVSGLEGCGPSQPLKSL